MDGGGDGMTVAERDWCRAWKLSRQLEREEAVTRAAQRPAHPIILAADLHGEHDGLLAYCAQHRPGTLILLGDMCLEQPLKVAYAPVFMSGWAVYYLLGNHDCKSEEKYDYLLADHPEGHLSLRVIEVEGIRVGGLSGIFRKALVGFRGGEEHVIQPAPR